MAQIFILLLGVLLLVPADFVLAKEVPAQARIFAGSNLADPVNVNTELTAQGLKKIDSVTLLGAEVLFPAAKFFDVGLRYTKRGIVREELTNAAATEYEAEISQDSVAAILRVPFFRSAIVRADAFAGFGGTNTTYKIKSASQDGELTRKDNNSWFADTMSSFGGSVAVGYKKFYFVVEAGVENNKVEGFKSTGNINNNINVIDLSGSYFTIGFMFDGVGVSRK